MYIVFGVLASLVSSCLANTLHIDGAPAYTLDGVPTSTEVNGSAPTSTTGIVHLLASGANLSTILGNLSKLPDRLVVMIFTGPVHTTHNSYNYGPSYTYGPNSSLDLSTGPSYGPQIGPSYGLTYGSSYGDSYGPTFGPSFGSSFGPSIGNTYGNSYGTTFGPSIGPAYGPTYGHSYGPGYGPNYNFPPAPGQGETVATSTKTVTVDRVHKDSDGPSQVRSRRSVAAVRDPVRPHLFFPPGFPAWNSKSDPLVYV